MSELASKKKKNKRRRIRSDIITVSAPDKSCSSHHKTENDIADDTAQNGSNNKRKNLNMKKRTVV